MKYTILGDMKKHPDGTETFKLDSALLKIVPLIGNVDTRSADAIEAYLFGLTSEKIDGVILDCTFMAYLDSKGLRFLFVLAKHCKTKGLFLYIVNMPESIRDLLYMVGMEKDFEIYNSREQALSVIENQL